MKKLYVFCVLVSIPAILLFSCKHEPVLPEHQVSFSEEVLPIIQMGCQHSGCHGDSLNQEFKLVDYDDVMENGDVKAGNPQDSKLYEVITTETGEDRMPREPYARLSDRNISMIYIWIAQGAQNN